MTDTPTPSAVPDAAAPPARSKFLRVLTTKPWVTAVVAVVVLGAGTGGYLTLGGSDSAAATQQVTTSLVTPATGTVRASVSATGTITAADSTDVSFGSAAQITSVRVAQGDTVTKGQVLGTIDTLALKATLAQARADLASARSTLATAQDSSDTTDTQLAADTAEVATRSSAVSTAVTALAAATLRSPITGTVAEVSVAKGDRSSGSGSTSTSTGSGSTGSGSAGAGGGSGETAGGTDTTAASTSTSSGDFVVIGMKKWTVSATVDDTQVGLIKKGNQVQLTTDNVTGTVFGIVQSVAVLSSSTSGSATYPVVISVTGSPTGLHDGASATAAIVYKQATNVLTVPTTAVHTEAGASYVYVSTNGTKTKRTVTTGLASGGTTQIASGLATTDKVVVETVTGGARGTTGGGTRQQTGEGGTGTGGYPGGGMGGGTGNFPGGGQAPSGGFPGGGTR